MLQFDSTLQATVQAMGQVGQHLGNSKKQKKKDRSLLRQASFFKGGKGNKARLSTAQKNELERGEHFTGHLYKRSSSGSWKKKWCVLKGAVLSYSKYVLLRMWYYIHFSIPRRFVSVRFYTPCAISPYTHYSTSLIAFTVGTTLSIAYRWRESSTSVN